MILKWVKETRKHDHIANLALISLLIILFVLQHNNTLTFVMGACSPFELRYANEVCNPKMNQHCAPFLDCIEGKCLPWNYLLEAKESTASACESSGLILSSNNTCLLAKFLGDACIEDNQCMFGVCRKGKCVEKRENEPCNDYFSKDCGTNMYCNRDHVCKKRDHVDTTCNTREDAPYRIGSCRRDLTCVTTGPGVSKGTCKSRAGNKDQCNYFGYNAPMCTPPYYCPVDVFDNMRRFNCKSNLDALKENERCEYDAYFKVQNVEVCAFGLSCNITSSTCQKKQMCSDRINNCFSGATHQYMTAYCDCSQQGQVTDDEEDSDGKCTILENCRFTNADLAKVRSCVVDKCYGGTDSDFVYTSETLTRVMFDEQACPFKKCSHTIKSYYCCMIDYHKKSPNFTLPYGANNDFLINNFCKPEEQIRPLELKWTIVALGLVGTAALVAVLALIIVWRTKPVPVYDIQVDTEFNMDNDESEYSLTQTRTR